MQLVYDKGDVQVLQLEWQFSHVFYVILAIYFSIGQESKQV